MEEKHQFRVERVQIGNVWSKGVLLEVIQNDEATSFSLSKGDQTITIHLSAAQWQELRRLWNQPM